MGARASLSDLSASSATFTPASRSLSKTLYPCPNFFNDPYACRFNMSSSAVPHVVAFLTRPLLPAFPFAAVSSAQLILSASLASQPSATYTLKAASTPPAPLLAASIGAGIPWAAWLAALGSDDILLFYGPGYVKARLGDAAVTDVWSEETQGSVVPIAASRVRTQVGPSPLLQQNTNTRLRAVLLSARVRGFQRRQAAAAAAEPIRIPSLPFSSPSDSDSSSDSDSESDYCSDSASSASSYSHVSSPITPPKCTPVALPAVGAYRPPFARAAKVAATATKPTLKAFPIKASPKAPAPRPVPGGVTRVMTGGVMLGPRHVGVVRATRS
ncbi:hypothetical protein B0H14DRAFT_3469966 [Mycena olivaceomarginata]|nr:hypothetical protein B0H14DRAFT_3469966 [Mycena olivaceomarginata]